MLSAIDANAPHMLHKMLWSAPRIQNGGVDPELIQRLSSAGIRSLAGGYYGRRERQHGPNTLHHRRIEKSCNLTDTLRDTTSWYAERRLLRYTRD